MFSKYKLLQFNRKEGELLVSNSESQEMFCLQNHKTIYITYRTVIGQMDAIFGPRVKDWTFVRNIAHQPKILLGQVLVRNVHMSTVDGIIGRTQVDSSEVSREIILKFGLILK